MRITMHIGFLVLAELALLPMYYVMLIFLAFNDTGNQADNWFDFLKMQIPLYIYLALVLLIAILVQKWSDLNRWVIWGVFVLAHLVIAAYAMTLFMGVYLEDDLNPFARPGEPIPIIEPEPEEKVDYTTLYEIDYQNGAVTRSGEIGDQLTWVFTDENGEYALRRWAENETAFDLSSVDVFEKGHTYTIHLSRFGESGKSEYVQVSNQVTFTHQ